jgi:hypothetical protein
MKKKKKKKKKVAFILTDIIKLSFIAIVHFSNVCLYVFQSEDETNISNRHPFCLRSNSSSYSFDQTIPSFVDDTHIRSNKKYPNEMNKNTYSTIKQDSHRRESNRFQWKTKFLFSSQFSSSSSSSSLYATLTYEMWMTKIEREREMMIIILMPTLFQILLFNFNLYLCIHVCVYIKSTRMSNANVVCIELKSIESAFNVENESESENNNHNVQSFFKDRQMSNCMYGRCMIC